MANDRSCVSSKHLAELSGPERDAALLDVNEVAALLNCSARHVYRMSDTGRMPLPLKLGALVRWRRLEIGGWIAAGCPAICRAEGHLR